ncbi:lipopolysaccharide transport periplasmic protein LptA [Desulfosediminicola sp.]|uniref:lipopolysaccharide transport periplasmic protein LptA n=1 Tax=Desulfosediminicola sp. TaxID=2886825 RepID=UPI003AF213A0
MIKRSSIIRILAVSLLITLSLSVTSYAEKKDPPIRIEADRMSSLEKESSVIFIGNVDARQEDVRIRSDKMTVYYTQQAKNNSGARLGQKVEKIQSDGNVEITRGDWLGTSQKMIYQAAERKFRLIGSAKAWQGENMVSGDEIIYYIDEGRSEVVAKRTKAVVGENGEGKDKKPGRVNMTILEQ